MKEQKTYYNIIDRTLWTAKDMQQYYVDFKRNGMYTDLSYEEFIGTMLEGNFEEIESSEMEDILFIFDDELYVDEAGTCVDGYVWIGTVIAEYIYRFIDDLPSEIDNLNLYSFYNLETGDVHCEGTYYVGENQKEYELPLTEKQKEMVIKAMDDHCWEWHGMGCLEYVNSAREDIDMPPIVQNQKKER